MITVLGSMNIDEFFDVDHFVLPSETLAAGRITRQAGGKGLNQAIAAARAGSGVRMAGMTGKDGGFLLDLLRENGVDCAQIEQREDVLSGRAVIQRTPDSENAILLSPGANHQIDKTYIQQVLASMNSKDALLLQNEISSLNGILEEADSRNIPVFFNPAPMTLEAAESDLSKTAGLILNRMEACQLCGCDVEKANGEDLLRRLKKRLPRTIIVLTLGKNGAVMTCPDEDGFWSVDAFDVPAVDSTGAGDTFTGYFVSSLVSGEPPRLALKKAAAAAALSVTKEGAAASVPCMDEVEEMLLKHRNHVCRKRAFKPEKS